MPRTGRTSARRVVAARRGRPRTSGLTRLEQLREAKRRQRQRDRQLGVEVVQVKIGARHAEVLRRLLAAPRGQAQLRTLLDRFEKADRLTHRAPLVEVARYPELRLLAWNRPPDAAIAETEALSLYEANWRFVDRDRLTPREAALIRRLVREHGGGVLNARGGQGLLE